MESIILTALRSAIQERGLTIADVAKAAKVNRTTLSLMLSGVKSPTLRTLCRVCGVLKIELKIINQPNMENQKWGIANSQDSRLENGLHVHDEYYFFSGQCLLDEKFASKEEAIKFIKPHLQKLSPGEQYHIFPLK